MATPENYPNCEICRHPQEAPAYAIFLPEHGATFTGHRTCVTREAARFDICECGDYREQHEANGACRLNDLGHGGAPDCHEFRLSKLSSEPHP